MNEVGDNGYGFEADSVVGNIVTWKQELKLDCIQGVAIDVGTSEENKWRMRQLWSRGIVHVRTAQWTIGRNHFVITEANIQGSLILASLNTVGVQPNRRLLSGGYVRRKSPLYDLVASISWQGGQCSHKMTPEAGKFSIALKKRIGKGNVARIC